jgi:DNA-binding IclR family transcriptional regulator
MTPRVLWLGAGVQAAVPIARPRLDQLSELIGRSTPLCILDGAEIVTSRPQGPQREEK